MTMLNPYASLYVSTGSLQTTEIRQKIKRQLEIVEKSFRKTLYIQKIII